MLPVKSVWCASPRRVTLQGAGGETSPVFQAEGQKVEQKQVAAEKQVLSKLEKIKLDQDQRAAALAKEAQAEEHQVWTVASGLGSEHA